MTTIIFPILTFSLVLLLGITIGFFISTIIERKITFKQKKDLCDSYTYKDTNGNIVKVPIQDHTMITDVLLDHNKFNSKIKLNKYEMSFLIQNIQKHLENIGETPEENEHVQDLFNNLLKSKKK